MHWHSSNPILFTISAARRIIMRCGICGPGGI